MLHTFEQLQQLVDERIKSTLFEQKPQSLYENVNYILHLDAKRIRPVMCLMSYELYNSLNDDAWHAALAIEIFHNFTLVHDDIMDNAPLRRGNVTIHEKSGMPTAILTGDVMSILSYTYLNKIKHEKLNKVFEVFNQTAVEVCEGQQIDMDFEQLSNISIEQYIDMITLKTSVLLACAMKIGALLGGASEGSADVLYEFAKNLGIAFQLKDDYLDAFGDPAQTGKQVGGDIKANKKTFLLIKAIEKADPVQRQQIQDLLTSNAEDKVEQMLLIFEELGIKSEATQIKEKYTQKAFDFLESLPVQNANKTQIKRLAEYLLLREK